MTPPTIAPMLGPEDVAPTDEGVEVAVEVAVEDGSSVDCDGSTSLH